MSISLKPKDHFGAIYCYIHTPFYTFKNLILKSEIQFTDDEIIQYEVSPSSRDEVYLHYLKNGFQGNILLNSNLEPIEIDQAKIKYNSRANFQKLKEIMSVIFNRHSPLMWGYFLQVLIGLSFLKYAEKQHYWIKFSNETLSICDKDCLKHNYQIAWFSIIHSFKNILPLIVGLYFLLFHFKKIKNGNTASMVKWAAFVMCLIGIISSLEVYKNLRSPGTQQALSIAFTPNKTKSINRKISSVIETSEEFKETFDKDEKPIQTKKENFNLL